MTTRRRLFLAMRRSIVLTGNILVYHFTSLAFSLPVSSETDSALPGLPQEVHFYFYSFNFSQLLILIFSKVLDDLSSSHPGMRRLLANSPNITNSTSNNTCQAGKPWRPACGALQPVGQRYVCISYDEYFAAATMDENSEQYTDGSFFCEGYVDYAAACDLNDNLTCNNAFAATMFENFKRALAVYSCKSYSRIWTCDDCAAAYKRWLCSQVYKKILARILRVYR